MRATPLLLALCTTALPAQSASYTLFGTACTPFPSSVPAPSLTVAGVPQLGSSFTVTYTGPNYRRATPSFGFATAQPVLLTGVSNTSWAGLSLPFEIPSIFTTPHQPMFHGCTLLVSPDIAVATAMMPSGTSYRDRITIRVPNDTGLLGVRFYQQWLGVEVRPCCPYSRAIYSSNGGAAVIGL